MRAHINEVVLIRLFGVRCNYSLRVTRTSYCSFAATIKVRALPLFSTQKVPFPFFIT